MASLWTNRLRLRMLEVFTRKQYAGGNLPTNLYVALVTSATAPTADTDTFSELTEIVAGNGYTAGGYQIAFNSTDWDVLTEDDTNDRALVQLKDMVWTASGGPIPASGSGARYAVLTDDNVTPGSREVLASFDLAADRTVSDGQSLTLQNCELRIA